MRVILYCRQRTIRSPKDTAAGRTAAFSLLPFSTKSVTCALHWRNSRIQINHMGYLIYTLFLFLFCVPLGQAQSAVHNNSACFPEFWSDRKRFDVCLKELCFIFKFDPPFVFNDSKLAREPSQPFRCDDRERLYPGLRGLFFDVLDTVGRKEPANAKPRVRDARCIYAGDECTYDGEVRFINSTVQSGAKHQFLTGGNLNFMSNRVMRNTVQSAHTFSQKIGLLHRREMEARSLRAASKIIFMRFEWSSWGVVGAFVILLCIIVALYARCFSAMRKNGKPPILIWLINGVPGVNQEQRAAWRALLLAITVFVTVVFLLYELALALSIFEGPEPKVTGWTQLGSLGPNRFSAGREAAVETILRQVLEKQGFSYNDTDFPWTRVNGFEETVAVIQNKTADFALVLDQNIKFELHRRKLCSEMSVTELNLLPIMGGWYYSTAIRKDVRMRIDKLLLEMWNKKETVNGLGSIEEVPLDCGLTSSRVDFISLILLLCITVGVVLLIAGGFMVKAKYFPAPQRTNDFEDEWDLELSSSA